MNRWVALLAIGLFLLLYLRSPIDLLPDRIWPPLGLLDDLLVVLAAVWWARRRFGAPGRTSERRNARAEQPGADAGERLDPYRVLGVAHGASPEEIARAYREQMKRYHPDRVEGLGEELRRVAHRKAIEIQRAYEALGKP